MYHCLLCHNQFDLKSLQYSEDAEPGLCISCLYSHEIDWNNCSCPLCPKEA